nr:hypothetical protein Iba_chr07aCG12430 [Ipomoea batatas]
MGGSVGYSYMLKKLKHDMAPIRLDNDYYLVKFHSIMDYEFAKRELLSNLWRNVPLVTRPLHPTGEISSWPAVPILCVPASVQCEVALPWRPTFRGDEAVNERGHDDCPGELLPWPSEVDFDGRGDALEGGIREDLAGLEDNAAHSSTVLSTLGRHHAGLILHWLPHDHLAVLEHGRRVPEDEVDGAGDGAAAVELAVGVGVEGVLVPANEPVSLYCHRGGLISADPVDEILVSGDHGLARALPDENNVVNLLRNNHVFAVHAGLDKDDNSAVAFGRDGGQSAVDAIKFPTSVLGDHHVGFNGARGSSEEAASGGVYEMREFIGGVIFQQPTTDPRDFQGLEEVGELSEHSQGVAGELHGGFKEVPHFLAGVAGGVLEGIQASLFESDGGGEPNLEVVTVFGVDGSRFLNLASRPLEI